MSRVWCLGLGPVGGVIAARLSRAGIDVLAFDGDLEHVRVVLEQGLEVGGLGGGTRTVIAARPIHEVALATDYEPDIVLFGDRADVSVDHLRTLAPQLRDTTQVVCLHKDIVDAVARIVGSNRTIAARIGFQATLRGPGSVSLDSPGHITIIRPNGETDAALQGARQMLGLAFPTTIATPPPTSEAPALARVRRADPLLTLSTRRARNLRSALAVAIASVALVALVVLFVRTIGGNETPSGGPPGAGATPGANVPTQTPSLLGRSARTLDGNTITVHTVESEAKSNKEVLIPAAKGKQLAAVEIEFCVREDFGGNGSVGESQFQVGTDDGKEISFWDTPDYAKDPRLSAAPVRPGECSKGWVTFEIPERKRIVRVLWTPSEDSAESLSWNVAA